jgi:twinkle protein
MSTQMVGYKTLEELFTLDKDKVAQYLVTGEDYQEELEEIFKYGEERGDKCHIERLNDQFSWRKGYVYCFSGYPGSGKSEFLNYLGVLMAKKMGHKIALYSPENYPVKHLAASLMKSYLGKNIAKGWQNQCTKEEFDQAYEFLNAHITFLRYDDIPRLTQLLTDYQRLSEEKGVDMFITDPFNSVAEGASKDPSQLQVALTQMKMFADNMECYNAIVEHPIKPQANKDGSLPDCAPWHLYGGSMWWNKMDCIVTVSRDLFDNNPAVRVRTWKMKLQRLNGVPGEETIYYDIATGRYEEEPRQQSPDTPDWAKPNDGSEEGPAPF